MKLLVYVQVLGLLLINTEEFQLNSKNGEIQQSYFQPNIGTVPLPSIQNHEQMLTTAYIQNTAGERKPIMAAIPKETYTKLTSVPLNTAYSNQQYQPVSTQQTYGTDPLPSIQNHEEITAAYIQNTAGKGKPIMAAVPKETYTKLTSVPLNTAYSNQQYQPLSTQQTHQPTVYSNGQYNYLQNTPQDVQHSQQLASSAYVSPVQHSSIINHGSYYIMPEMTPPGEIKNNFNVQHSQQKNFPQYRLVSQPQIQPQSNVLQQPQIHNILTAAQPNIQSNLTPFNFYVKANRNNNLQMALPQHSRPTAFPKTNVYSSHVPISSSHKNVQNVPKSKQTIPYNSTSLSNEHILPVKAYSTTNLNNPGNFQQSLTKSKTSQNEQRQKEEENTKDNNPKVYEEQEYDDDDEEDDEYDDRNDYDRSRFRNYENESEEDEDRYRPTFSAAKYIFTDDDDDDNDGDDSDDDHEEENVESKFISNNNRKSKYDKSETVPYKKYEQNDSNKHKENAPYVKPRKTQVINYRHNNPQHKTNKNSNEEPERRQSQRNPSRRT